MSKYKILISGVIFSLILTCLKAFMPTAQLSGISNKIDKKGVQSIECDLEPSFNYKCTELPVNCVFAVPTSMGWERKHDIFVNASLKLINLGLDRTSLIFNFHMPEGVSQNDYLASEEDKYINFHRFSSLKQAMLKDIDIDQEEMRDHTLAFLPDIGEGIFNHTFSYSLLDKGKGVKFRCISIIVFSFDQTNLIGIVVDGNKNDFNEILLNCLELRQFIGAKQANGDILFGGGKTAFLLTKDLVAKQKTGLL